MHWIDKELSLIRASGRHRSIPPVRRDKLDFSTNDYLGLASAKFMKQAASDAVSMHGTGGRASRLVAEPNELYEQLESLLCRFLNTESARVLGSGFLTNLGVLTALADKNTTIVADHKIHASLIDGIKLSGAKLLRFKHNDQESFLRQTARVTTHKLIVVLESVYSMDGDSPDMSFFVGETERRDALLLIDDAHAVGVYGAGLCRNPSKNVILTGTFSKALGSYGGYFACERRLADLITTKARSLIYSTALPPGTLGASIAALQFVIENPGAGKHVLELSEQFREKAGGQGFDVGSSSSHIVPVILGPDVHEAAMAFREAGVKVSAIRAPTVLEGTERLRFSFCAQHSKSDLGLVLECLRSFR